MGHIALIMKKTYRTISSLWAAMCAGALTLLGFGCSDNEGGGNGLCMYGTPTGYFEVKGAVTDEAGNPVDNADIYVTHPEGQSGIYSFAKGKTDDKGDYLIETSDFPKTEIKVVCKPEDENLEPDSVNVKMKFEKDRKHDKDPWYSGKAKATVNFKLKKKK